MLEDTGGRQMGACSLLATALLVLACAPPRESTYDPVVGGADRPIPPNGGEGIACNMSFPAISLPSGANAKSTIYELRNTGTCPIEATIRPPRGRPSTDTVARGGRMIQALPALPGQAFTLTLTCLEAPGGETCNFALTVAEERQVNAPAPNPSFNVADPGAFTITTTQDNKCSTPEADKQAVIVVENNSRERIRVEYTVASTCDCPAFVGGEASVPARQRATKSTKVPRGATFTLSAFCTGANVNNSACSGTITGIRVLPDP